MRRFLILFAAVANLVLVDAVTKELAYGLLGAGASSPRTVEVIPHVFNLAYVENRGCAWGMFQGQVWPLAAFGLVALAFLIWKRNSVFALPRFVPRSCSLLPECLLYAGIIGNVIDRLFRGYVIDMFDFHWGARHFPCFNVADSLICVSVGILLLASFLDRPKAAGESCGGSRGA